MNTQYIDLKDNTLVLTTSQGPIEIKETSKGEIKLYSNKRLCILPTGSTSITIELKD